MRLKGGYTGASRSGSRAARSPSGTSVGSQRGSMTRAAVNTTRSPSVLTGPELTTCPTCELPVARRADGQLRSHRVGRRGQSWPCPGEDKGTL